MITTKARRKFDALIFWEKHGLEATMDAFGVKRRTLFLWKKKLRAGRGKPEALCEQSRAPQHRRIRAWSTELLEEIRRLRSLRPNLGKDKVRELLKPFCRKHCLPLPSASTTGRLMKDMGGLRYAPEKVTHFGTVKVRERRKRLRKPKGFKATHPGHLVALDTIEKHINGCRRYILTFEDVFSRFSFAWVTTSHASKAAQEFLGLCRQVFPLSYGHVLTDNGSEFAKCFAEEMRRLHLTHYHTYPRTPKMNAHCERFNRTIQEEFLNYHLEELLLDPVSLNRKLMEWLLWYNTERPHHSLQLQSPLRFLLSSPQTPKECNLGWTYTTSGKRVAEWGV